MKYDEIEGILKLKQAKLNESHPFELSAMESYVYLLQKRSL